MTEAALLASMFQGGESISRPSMDEAAGRGDLQEDLAALKAGLDRHLVSARGDGHGRGRSEGRAHGNTGAVRAVARGGH